MHRRLEQRGLNLSLADLDKMMDWQIGGRPSTSGVPVSVDTARSITAVFCAEKIISETIASVSLSLMARDKNGRRRKATEHPLYRVIHKKPNPWQSSLEWLRMMAGHTAIRGNAFSEIIRDPAGYPNSLIPRNPDKIKTVQLGDLGVGYGHVMPDGKVRPIPRGDMLHFRGISSNGIVGDSIVDIFRNVIGLALATEEHGARMFSNGTTIPFALSHPKGLSNVAYERLKASLAEEHAGVRNAHKPMILEEDMSVEKLGMTGVDSQFLESRQFHITEFARIWRIPPHMLSDLSHATYSNIEQQSLEFVTYTMLPWFVMMEQRMDIDLLSEEDQDEYYLKFNLNTLLRADMAARYASYAVGKQWGWLNSNKILELEDMDPIEGRAGDVYLTPMNMVDASIEPDTSSPTSEPAVMAKMLQTRLQQAHQEIFRDAASRLVRKEVAAFRKAIEKYKDDTFGLEAYVDIFYGSHAPVVVRAMLPALTTYAQAITAASLVWEEVDVRSLEVFVSQHADRSAAKYLNDQRARVKAALKTRSISALLEDWEADASNGIATRESTALSSALMGWLAKEIPA